ncbi:hypothetical protein [Kitasatospora sp. MBT63]|uniref:hypothetical protein n=1 Tax=Kitasatospora sp. MBT63 TaxID=1444768 RepID=UPI00053A59B6|nr:hypothetical protein [Kitasatospora sp. MBT63]
MIEARPVAALDAPLPPGDAADPAVVVLGGRPVLVQRGDTELVAVDLRQPDRTVRFPAPWPRRYGTVALAPGLGLALFAGVHALRAVDPAGATRWEVRHACWEDGCPDLHEEAAQYVGAGSHPYASKGSAVFSADGSVVWAHVRPTADADDDEEEWLVLDAADGRVLARAQTGTIAAGSEHVPHPDPRQMGLSVGEGQDGVPLRWGRWDGDTLTVGNLGRERVLLAVSPSGERMLTVTHYQETLAVHRAGEQEARSELDATDAVPSRPGDTGPAAATDLRWDYYGGFLDEETVIAGTSESEQKDDEEYGGARHWLLAAEPLRPAGRVAYPFPVSGPPHPLGDGTWATVTGQARTVHLWERAPERG